MTGKDLNAKPKVDASDMNNTLVQESEVGSDDEDPYYDEDFFEEENDEPESAIFVDEDGKPAFHEGFSEYYTEEELRERELYSESVFKTHLPFHILFIILGRFPSSWSSDSKTKVRTYAFRFSHPNSIYFMFTSFLSIVCLATVSWNLFYILMELNTGKGPGQISSDFNYEKAIIQRHFITVIVVWTSLLNIAISSVNFLYKRHHFALFLNFWSQSVQALEMDPAKELKKVVIQFLVVYLGTTFVLMVMGAGGLGPAIHTAPFVMGLMLFRRSGGLLYSLNVTNKLINTNEIERNETTYSVIENSASTHIAYTATGAVILVLIFTWSKIYLLYFAFHCRLLKNAFAQWNGRLFLNVLVGSRRKTSSAEQAAVYSSLFTDHCCLLDLLEAQDYLYTGLVETFFAIQTFSMCFEFYFFLRCLAKGADTELAFNSLNAANYYVRPFDWIPAIILFLLSFYVLVNASYSAAQVGEEANAGIEVVRRKSLVGRKSDQELFFVLSMFSSYTAYRQLQVSGGGYFYYNKDFLIGTLSAVFSYFLITYQFDPTFDYNSKKFPDGPVPGRIIFGKLLEKLEGRTIPFEHYKYNKTFP